MASTTCEILWVLKLLKDFKVDGLLPVTLYCDNKSSLQLAANPVFHERSKHFEIDLHLVREKCTSGVIKTVFIDSIKQIADIFTKGLGKVQHELLSSYLGLINLYKDKIEGGC